MHYFKTTVLVTGLFFVNLNYAQTKTNLGLKKELDSIYIVDQKYRELLSSPLLQTKTDSIAESFKVPGKELMSYLIQRMQQSDSLNMKRIRIICSEYGYPGKSLVGAPTNEAVFFVIQHSNSIDEYLPLIKTAAENGELPFHLYAMMLDRALMYHGKAQVYGTQGKGFERLNPQTNKKEFIRIIWPIENPEEVNERRKKAGFDQTVEENAKRLGIEYKALTLDDVKKMQL